MQNVQFSQQVSKSKQQQSGADLKWHRVCPVSDLVINSGVCALIENTQIAIFAFDNLSDANDNNLTVYAVSNFDPIGKANVISRGMTGSIDGEAVVASPLYKQHFVLSSGQCIEQEDVSLSAFATRIEDNQLFIAFTAGSQAADSISDRHSLI
jgi:nitrite reductase (NADH) small subunit